MTAPVGAARGRTPVTTGEGTPAATALLRYREPTVESVMPVILWWLGVPLSVVLVLWLVGVV